MGKDEDRDDQIPSRPSVYNSGDGEEVELCPALWSVCQRRVELGRRACASLLFAVPPLWACTPTGVEQRRVEDALLAEDGLRAVYYLQRAHQRGWRVRDAEEALQQWVRYFHADPSAERPLGLTFHSDRLFRERHLHFLGGILDGTRALPSEFLSLEASQTWIAYWVAHALDVLGRPLTAAEAQGIIKLCRASQSEHGGYGGGPGHVAHAAATYAAVSALCIAGTVDRGAHQVTQRGALTRWMKCDLALADGGGGRFRVSLNGEIDVRAVYCVLATASLLGVLDDDLCRGCVAFIGSLRSFDGAFGGEPLTESHGGYTYCAVASLRILRDAEWLTAAEFAALVAPARDWLTRRQLRFEGGFQGRTHKLVDSCYSFWLAAAARLCDAPFREPQLAHYILRYCQDVEHGGLRDKPHVPADLYHTCYALSGLSLTQSTNTEATLRPVHPAYNLTYDTLHANPFFSKPI
eukprot:ctg_44.g18